MLLADQGRDPRPGFPTSRGLGRERHPSVTRSPPGFYQSIYSNMATDLVNNPCMSEWEYHLLERERLTREVAPLLYGVAVHFELVGVRECDAVLRHFLDVVGIVSDNPSAV